MPNEPDKHSPKRAQKEMRGGSKSAGNARRRGQGQGQTVGAEDPRAADARRANRARADLARELEQAEADQLARLRQMGFADEHVAPQQQQQRDRRLKRLAEVQRLADRLPRGLTSAGAAVRLAGAAGYTAETIRKFIESGEISYPKK